MAVKYTINVFVLSDSYLPTNDILSSPLTMARNTYKTFCLLYTRSDKDISRSFVSLTIVEIGHIFL